MSTPFSENFAFGAATASYQIEGAAHEDGRGRSIWDTFSHTPGAIVTGETGDVACDHYHRWEEDLDILAALGVDSYRFSIAWPRVQPSGKGTSNQAGLDFYSRLVDGLLTRGITPFVTLYHWDLPQALEDKGGWMNRDTAFRFGEYSEIMARVLGDRVHSWATLNEPWCAAMLGYASGIHAPGKKSPEGALMASHHLNLAHGLGAQALRASTTGSVGVVVNVHQLYPAASWTRDFSRPETSPDLDRLRADQAACERADAVGSWIYTDPMLRGTYDPLVFEVTSHVSSWGFIEDGDLETIHQPIDFLGINYYQPTWISAGVGKHLPGPEWVGVTNAQFMPARPPLTEMGWTIEPQGLSDLLVRVHERYPEINLIVAENGAAMPDAVSDDGKVHDNDRIDYLKAHVAALQEAMERGVPLIGYYVWSLLDNFEWSFGTSKRFGLIRTQYDTQERVWKDSAHWYKRFLATRSLD